jgi:hypothetical protein
MGGPSHRGNCWALCRRHHRLKAEKKLTVHQLGPAAFMMAAPDGRMYLVAGDGNLVAVAEAEDDGTFDLDQGAPPPREVHQIIPR